MGCAYNGFEHCTHVCIAELFHKSRSGGIGVLVGAIWGLDAEGESGDPEVLKILNVSKEPDEATFTTQ